MEAVRAMVFGKTCKNCGVNPPKCRGQRLCRACFNARQRELRQKNPERRRAQEKKSYQKYRAKKLVSTRAWIVANKERVLDRYLLRTYGISGADFSRMLSEQNGRCACCSRSGNGDRRLVVDHNHVTGKVRALLCTVCNVMLGQARECPEILDAAKMYLEAHK